MHHINVRFPGGLSKCLTLSYDDAVEQDIRLAQLMKEHGIAGTFNVNSGRFSPEGTVHAPGKIHRRMTLQQCKDTYLCSPLFEISTHGLTHPFYPELPLNHITQDIAQDRCNLENAFDTLCRGHAYPYGRYDQNTIDALRACGIVYARTTKSTGTFDLPTDWLILNPTCHHRDVIFPELTQKFVEGTPDRQPWLFYVWGHAYEFEQKDNWHVIETFFEKVGGREDIWYATNIQVYDYLQAYHSLIYSWDCTTIHNPSSTDVWICAGFAKLNTQVIRIPAGQTVRLEASHES